jgi:hypothetical protein
MMDDNSMSARFRRRLAWLGRMPMHYRILFGTQALFTVFAFNYRLHLIERGRQELEAEEQMAKQNADAEKQ